MLNSWLDRLLVLLVFTTGVLTLLALNYVRSSSAPVAQSSAPAVVEAAPEPAVEAEPAPRPEPATPSDPGSGFAQAGLNALQAGDAAAAIRWFERATQASPQNAAWRRGLADAYRASGDAQRASEEELRAQALEAPSAGTSGD